MDADHMVPSVPTNAIISSHLRSGVGTARRTSFPGADSTSRIIFVLAKYLR